jgi:uncharacterized membrane protein YraQ (UPF0718 family)
VDSITISYALLDPIMTFIRPMAAFATAIVAGCIENLLEWPKPSSQFSHDSGFLDNNKYGSKATCEYSANSNHHRKWAKLRTALRYALVEVWGDIAIWFFGGLLIAGVIMALIPDEFMVKWLDGGISSMLVMLVIGIPLYICATASTPVAAALILKGVSPGTALVFLLVGPATNITSISVLIGILGKKSTFRYLVILSLCAILFGLATDQLYKLLAISPQAVIGEASELMPYGLKLGGALILLLLSINPFSHWLKKKAGRQKIQCTSHSGFPDISAYKRKK